MNIKMKSVRAQSVKPVSDLSERDRVYDKELLETLEETEEGEFGVEDM